VPLKWRVVEGGAVAAPPHPTTAPDTHDRHLSYIHTDADLPPVAIIDRSPIGTGHKIVFGVIAVLGAVAWAIIAFVRGETVNAVWFVVAAICTYAIGYRFYARLIEAKIVHPRDDHATPAEILDDGTDYVPTDRRVLFGHHFAAIAGAGPLVGPVLATQMGYLPCSIWIIFGAVFAGAVQDYLVLWISTRRRGRSLGQMTRDELGATGGAAALVGAFVIMVIIIAVLALVVVRGLAQSPWGVFSIAMTIPIALFMGCYLRFLRPGRIAEVSVIGFVLLMLAVASGDFVSETSWGASWLNLSPVTVSWLIVTYGFVASVLPVWLLLAPRDYLSTFMKVGATATAADYVNRLGLSGAPATANQLSQAAAEVGEKSIVSRTGGAPTLAVGMSEVLQRVFGGAGLKAFRYHFAIMFEALFILTAVDAGTRVARFMLSDALGNLGGPLAKLRNPSWRPGLWGCSLAVAGAWGSILLMGVTDPLGGINTRFPLFGIANQLLAAIALTVVTVVVINKGYLKWAWIPGIPLLWDLTVTLTASWQKIFSSDPNVGYWTQHFQYAAAKASGKKAFGLAKTPDQLADVIRNTFIQGTLSIVFAVVVVIVVLAGIIVVYKAIRGHGRPLTEDDPVPSTMFAPSGMISTAGEREVQRQWDALRLAPLKRTDHAISSVESPGTGAS
jgi:carbon starvation protein CstA